MYVYIYIYVYLCIGVYIFTNQGVHIKKSGHIHDECFCPLLDFEAEYLAIDHIFPYY